MAVRIVFKETLKITGNKLCANSFKEHQLYMSIHNKGRQQSNARLTSLSKSYFKANPTVLNSICQSSKEIHSSHTNQVYVHVERFDENKSIKDADSNSLKPVIIAHGMLGSASNWSSLAKNLCKNTGRTIIIYDARNHGKSGHTENMSYMDMSEDLKQLIEEGQEVPLTNPKSAILVGHSMGGRTCMYTALSFPNLVEAMVVVDISPINQKFNLEDGSDWNMDHFFHALKAVRFLQPSDIENWTIYKSRTHADKQLAHRIKDANIRAWLLMNMGRFDNGDVGWTNNLKAIHQAFRKDIATFPIDDISEGTTFKKQVLFIGGGESEYIPVHHHTDILELFPRSKFEYIDGAGHWVHSQKPRAFLEVLTGFLKDLP